eukprot:EG_transcript_3247
MRGLHRRSCSVDDGQPAEVERVLSDADSVASDPKGLKKRRPTQVLGHKFRKGGMQLVRTTSDALSRTPSSSSTVLSPVEVLSGPALCAEYTVDTTLLWFTEEIDPAAPSQEPSCHYVEPLPHHLHVVVHEGYFPAGYFAGFVDPHVVLKYGPLKDSTMPSTWKTGVDFHSHHLISTLKLFAAPACPHSHSHNGFREQLAAGLRRLEGDGGAQLDATRRHEDYEPPFLELSLIGWNRTIGNQTLGSVFLRVCELPGYSAPVKAPYLPPEGWYPLSEHLQPHATPPVDRRPERPALRLSAWFADLLAPEALAPVVGEVRLCIQSVVLTSKHHHLEKLHCPFVVLKYDRHWARLPILNKNPATFNRTFLFQIRDASTVFKIGVFDANRAGRFRGMVQIRISTLPNGKWVTLLMPLYVRKESMGASSVKQKGTISLSILWQHPNTLEYLSHYLKPTKPKAYYTRLYKEKGTLLAKQHETLLAAYLRNHVPPLSPEVISFLLHDSFAFFNMTTAKVQMKRFGQATKALGALSRVWHSVVRWEYPPLTVLAFVGYSWGVYNPRPAAQVVILAFLCLLGYGHVMRGRLEDQWSPDLTLFAESKKPGDDLARMHSYKPFNAVSQKIANAEKFALKFQQTTGDLACLGERVLGLFGHGCYDNSVGLLAALMLLALFLWVTFLPFEPLFIGFGVIQFRPPSMRSGTGGPLAHLLSRIPTREDRIIPAPPP